MVSFFARDGGLIAVPHVEILDARQVLEGVARDGRDPSMVAVTHVEALDALHVLRHRS